MKEINVFCYHGRLVIDSRDFAKLLSQKHHTVISSVFTIVEKGIKTPEEMRELFEIETQRQKTYRILITKEGCRLLCFLHKCKRNKELYRQSWDNCLSAFEQAEMHPFTEEYQH